MATNESRLNMSLERRDSFEERRQRFAEETLKKLEQKGVRGEASLERLTAAIRDYDQSEIVR
jgi:hypothetical protein